jgi:hypothetical protein
MQITLRSRAMYNQRHVLIGFPLLKTDAFRNLLYVYVWGFQRHYPDLTLHEHCYESTQINIKKIIFNANYNKMKQNVNTQMFI